MYWLLDLEGNKGPTALVETDGSMRITGVHRFGPKITKLADQQKIVDLVAGELAPRLKPCVKASSVDEEGIEPHEDLDVDTDAGAENRATRRSGNRPGLDATSGPAGGAGTGRHSAGDR